LCICEEPIGASHFATSFAETFVRDHGRKLAKLASQSALQERSAGLTRRNIEHGAGLSRNTGRELENGSDFGGTSDS
jgi:hypothetical protein